MTCYVCDREIVGLTPSRDAIRWLVLGWVTNLLTGRPSWYIANTKVNSAFHPYGVGKSSNLSDWGWGGARLSVLGHGWQVTLCDPLWQVTFVALRLVCVWKTIPLSTLNSTECRNMETRACSEKWIGNSKRRARWIGRHGALDHLIQRLFPLSTRRPDTTRNAAECRVRSHTTDNVPPGRRAASRLQRHVLRRIPT